MKKMPDSGSLTVLVIEPDVLARMTLAEYLRECGYRVLEGSIAADAFTLLDAGAKVDIVFAEIRLADDTDGFAFARQLRQAWPHIDVILCAGVANAADKAGELCEDGPLAKPYHPQEIVRRINVLRERRRATKNQ